MSEVKYTPGPWIPDRWYLGWYVSAPGDYPGTSRKTIAECREATLSPMMRHQCEANARLIAAAPELLKALRTLEMAANADGWPDGWGIVQEHMELALAKSEGK